MRGTAVACAASLAILAVAAADILPMAEAGHTPPCRMSVRRVDIYDVTDSGGNPRNNPDETLYPGDAFTFEFQYSFNRYCRSITVSDADGSDAVEVVSGGRGRRLGSGPVSGTLTGVAEIDIGGALRCHGGGLHTGGAAGWDGAYGESEDCGDVSATFRYRYRSCSHGENSRCRWATRTRTYHITPDVIAPVTDVNLWEHLDLLDPHGYPAANGDETNYPWDPIAIEHAAQFEWKNQREGTIRFEYDRRFSPLVEEGGFECDRRCSDRLTVDGTAAGTGFMPYGPASKDPRSPGDAYGNGGGMYAYTATGDRDAGDRLISYDVTVTNIGRTIQTGGNSTVQLVPVYDPEFEYYPYTVLADGRRSAYDDRQAVVIHYMGSAGSGPDDSDGPGDGGLHTERRSKITNFHPVTEVGSYSGLVDPLPIDPSLLEWDSAVPAGGNATDAGEADPETVGEPFTGWFCDPPHFRHGTYRCVAVGPGVYEEPRAAAKGHCPHPSLHVNLCHLETFTRTGSEVRPGQGVFMTTSGDEASCPAVQPPVRHGMSECHAMFTGEGYGVIRFLQELHDTVHGEEGRHLWYGNASTVNVLASDDWAGHLENPLWNYTYTYPHLPMTGTYDLTSAAGVPLDVSVSPVNVTHGHGDDLVMLTGGKITMMMDEYLTAKTLHDTGDPAFAAAVVADTHGMNMTGSGTGSLSMNVNKTSLVFDDAIIATHSDDPGRYDIAELDRYHALALPSIYNLTVTAGDITRWDVVRFDTEYEGVYHEYVHLGTLGSSEASVSRLGDGHLVTFSLPESFGKVTHAQWGNRTFVIDDSCHGGCRIPLPDPAPQEITVHNRWGGHHVLHVNASSPETAVHDPQDHGDQLFYFAVALAGLAASVAAAAYVIRYIVSQE